MKPILLHPAAYRELDQALAYYQAIDIELSASLWSILDEALTTLEANPRIGAQHRGSQYRRFVLRKFPYVIFYRELPEVIWILAVAHGRQKPDYWSDRDDEND